MLPEQDLFIEELHRKYFRKLTLYAMSVLRNRDRAQDIVQDTFHQALEDIEGLMVHENPGGWLMNTVKNKIRESERARRRYINRFVSLDSEISEELMPASELAAELNEPDEVLTLEKIEQALTSEEYNLLKRLVFDKASHLEVAKELGITVYASQKRLERIRKKLRKKFLDQHKTE